jgi:hypothetical protein
MYKISTAGGAGRYEIRLKGHLAARWATWFDGLTLTTCSDGTTTITGTVVDQSALHGILQRVRDLGLPLISVTRDEPDPLPLRSPADASSPPGPTSSSKVSSPAPSPPP